MKDKWTAFAFDVLRDMFRHRFSVDGEDIWSLALKHDVIERTVYDPDKHGEDDDVDPGDTYWVIAQHVERDIAEDGHII